MGVTELGRLEMKKSSSFSFLIKLSFMVFIFVFISKYGSFLNSNSHRLGTISPISSFSSDLSVPIG